MKKLRNFTLLAGLAAGQPRISRRPIGRLGTPPLKKAAPSRPPKRKR